MMVIGTAGSAPSKASSTPIATPALTASTSTTSLMFECTVKTTAHATNAAASAQAKIADTER